LEKRNAANTSHYEILTGRNGRYQLWGGKAATGGDQEPRAADPRGRDPGKGGSETSENVIKGPAGENSQLKKKTGQRRTTNRKLTGRNQYNKDAWRGERKSQNNRACDGGGGAESQCHGAGKGKTNRRRPLSA